MAHLLIVEDDINIQNHLKNKAKQINPNLNISTTGYSEEALKILQEQKIDVLFLDIQLLDYNGMLLAEKVRSMRAYEFMPIVFITGDRNWAWKAYNDINFCFYLVKPFSDEEIEHICKKVLLNYVVANKANDKPQVRLDYNNHSLKVYLSDIVYVESRLRRIYIKFLNEAKEYKYKMMPLNKFSEKLNEDFVQVHQAFLVNKNHIKDIDHKEHTMTMRNTRKKLPIGSSYRKMEKEWLS